MAGFAANALIAIKLHLHDRDFIKRCIQCSKWTRYLQKGLDIIIDSNIMIARMLTFHANRPPRTANSFVSDNDNRIPARVPEGHKYLQKTGVSLNTMGSIITITISTTYLSFLSSLSPLKVLSFLGKGILWSRS